MRETDCDEGWCDEGNTQIVFVVRGGYGDEKI